MDNQLIKITGPVSYSVFRLNETKIYLWSDYHSSPKLGACQEWNSKLQCDSINYTFDGIIKRNSNCWSILALFAEWTKYNNHHNISTDFYFETYFTKSETRHQVSELQNTIRERTGVEDQDDIYDPINTQLLNSVELFFHDCLTKSKVGCQYSPNVRFHYANTRYLDTNPLQIINIFNPTNYRTLLQGLIKGNSNISPQEDLTKGISNLYNEFKTLYDISHYLIMNSHAVFNDLYFDNNSIDIILKYKDLATIPSWVRYYFITTINDIRNIAATRNDIKIDIVAKEYTRLLSINPNIAILLREFIHNKLDDLIKKPETAQYLDDLSYIVTLLTDVSKQAQYYTFVSAINFISRLLTSETLIAFSALTMDIYLLSRMFIQLMVNDSKEIIVLAGRAHVRIYSEFLEYYLSAIKLYETQSIGKCITMPLSQAQFNPYNYRNNY